MVRSFVPKVHFENLVIALHYNVGGKPTDLDRGGNTWCCPMRRGEFVKLEKRKLIDEPFDRMDVSQMRVEEVLKWVGEPVQKAADGSGPHRPPPESAVAAFSMRFQHMFNDIPTSSLGSSQNQPMFPLIWCLHKCLLSVRTTFPRRMSVIPVPTSPHMLTVSNCRYHLVYSNNRIIINHTSKCNRQSNRASVSPTSL